MLMSQSELTEEPQISSSGAVDNQSSSSSVTSEGRNMDTLLGRRNISLKALTDFSNL